MNRRDCTLSMLSVIPARRHIRPGERIQSCSRITFSVRFYLIASELEIRFREPNIALVVWTGTMAIPPWPRLGLD